MQPDPSSICFLYPNEEKSCGTPGATHGSVHYVILATLCAILSLFIVALDGTFLSTVLNNQELRTKSNILLVMMAIPDLLKGLIPLPVGIYVFVNLYRCINPNILCNVELMMGVSGVVLVHLTTAVIVFVAGDIFLSIRAPYFYRSRVTQKTLIMSIATIWIILSLIIIPVGVNLKIFEENLTWIFVLFFIITILVAATVVVTYFLVQKEIGNMSRRSVSQYSTQDMSARQAQRKLIVTMCIVLVAYLFCYLPYIIIWNYMRFKGHTKYSYLFIHYTEALGMFKAVVNSFIYFFRVKAVRRCCSKCLRRIFFGDENTRFRSLNISNKVHPEQSIFPGQSSSASRRRRIVEMIPCSLSVREDRKAVRRRTLSRRSDEQTRYVNK